ncbi:MAG: [Fe-S]-binding protein [Betaproteobacteria bacterium HGW-Betaproteobacteria-10]|nr:MAG: [Fe-S]-binding protein [Betaproteobacteria bacterium HGW-Betaproteobacteria-10]
MNPAASALLWANDSPPLRAASDALNAQPAPDPLPAVSMSTTGRLVIIGEAAVAIGWAERLVGQRTVTVLALDALPPAAEIDEAGEFHLEAGDALTLTGHLGAYALGWQVAGERRSAEFDVVLDLSPSALIKRIELPDGYVAAGRDALEQALAVIDLLAFDGEFEKPRYVTVNDRLCAHGRAQKSGCSNCIEVCATEAIQGIGDGIRLDPYLCQGCGTCATVCPSGALAYQYPRVADVGLSLKAQIRAYRAAGGAAPGLLFYSTEAGRRQLAERKRSGLNLADDFIPVETWSVDAVGLDLMLGALALGAARVAVLGAGSHDLTPLRQQVKQGQAILNGLGYSGDYLRIVDSESTNGLADLASWPAPMKVPVAEFRLLADKRTSLEFVIDHLLKHAPAPVDVIPLPAGAPFGAIEVSAACTLCMSCAGACPAGAIKAAADAPRLSFLERNCLQCGLCANTCPENAITLTPRLWLKERRHERILREAEIFCCTTCGKPMGAKPIIDNMLAKLAGHSMFADPAALKRLTMCGDCRVIDLVTQENSLKAWEMSE